MFLVSPFSLSLIDIFHTSANVLNQTGKCTRTAPNIFRYLTVCNTLWHEHILVSIKYWSSICIPWSVCLQYLSSILVSMSISPVFLCVSSLCLLCQGYLYIRAIPSFFTTHKAYIGSKVTIAVLQNAILCRYIHVRNSFFYHTRGKKLAESHLLMPDINPRCQRNKSYCEWGPLWLMLHSITSTLPSMHITDDKGPKCTPSKKTVFRVRNYSKVKVSNIKDLGLDLVDTS